MAMKKWLLAGAIAASLAGAGLVGALVGTTSVSYAEDATHEDGGGPPGSGRGGPGGAASLEVAADALGITEDDLRTELEAGDSITSVAEANDVELQSVIDALVEDATARIQERIDAGDLDAEEGAEQIAELPDRMAEFVAREGLPARGDC